jgi:hypothetical protein
MKVYDLKGVFVEGKKAIIAVSLPRPNKNNAYNVFNVYNISDGKDNKIVIHLKDFSKPPLVVKDDNLELFIVELKKKEFDNFDFTKHTVVALIHHNADNLPKTPQEIYDEAYNLKKGNEVVGKGTIRS